MNINPFHRARSFLAGRSLPDGRGLAWGLVLLILVGQSFDVWRARAQQITTATPAAFSNKPVSVEMAINALWPEPARIDRLADIGRGKAIVFTPDISPSGNREFYERLGFVFIEDASWERVFKKLETHNAQCPHDPIQMLLLETHGAGGNGLELQASAARQAGRSYLSIGGLQERLAALNISACVVNACNVGRLFRPQIYRELNMHPNDKRLAPATLGIVGASSSFTPMQSRVTILRRAELRLGTVTQGEMAELSPASLELMETTSCPDGKMLPCQPAPRTGSFAVSTLFLQLLLKDARLRLTDSGYAVNKSSRYDLSDWATEALFQKFLTYLDQVATREMVSRRGWLLTAGTVRQPLCARWSRAGDSY